MVSYCYHFLLYLFSLVVGNFLNLGCLKNIKWSRKMYNQICCSSCTNFTMTCLLKYSPPRSILNVPVLHKLIFHILLQIFFGKLRVREGEIMLALERRKRIPVLDDADWAQWLIAYFIQIISSAFRLYCSKVTIISVGSAYDSLLLFNYYDRGVYIQWASLNLNDVMIIAFAWLSIFFVNYAPL